MKYNEKIIELQKSLIKSLKKQIKHQGNIINIQNSLISIYKNKEKGI
jgi:hypothetical protein